MTFTGPWTSEMKRRSTSVSQSAIGLTQSAPASRYAFARPTASGTRAARASEPATARNGPMKTSTLALTINR
jgi:hypothetical protein